MTRSSTWRGSDKAPKKWKIVILAPRSGSQRTHPEDLDSFPVSHQLFYLQGRRPCIFLRVETIQHGIQRLTVSPCAPLFELILCNLLWRGGESPSCGGEHFGDVIACPDPGALHQAQHQVKALRFL